MVLLNVNWGVPEDLPLVARVRISTHHPSGDAVEFVQKHRISWPARFGTLTLDNPIELPCLRMMHGFAMRIICEFDFHMQNN